MRQLSDLVGRIDAQMTTSSDSDGDSEGDVAGGSDFFEGAEKLFEITFHEAHSHSHTNNNNNDTGLRSVARGVWEDMLALVNCQIVSVISSSSQDAYLLRSEPQSPFPPLPLPITFN